MNLFYGKGEVSEIPKEFEEQYTVKLAFIDAGMVTSLSEKD